MVSIVILSTGNVKNVWADLKAQDYQDHEIIVAREKGIVNAMNLALEASRGTILVRVDDDVRIPGNWLRELLRPFSDPFVAGVTGPTFVPEDRIKNRDSIRWAEKPNWFLKWMFDGDPKARAKIYKCGSVSYGSNYENHVWEDFECDHLEGTNWAMRTDLIRQVGGFDPKFDGVAEWFDTDVEQKIKKSGYKLIYNPKAFLHHMLEKGEHHSERFEGWSRMKNWLRFHKRHSKFHPKMVIWFMMMGGYFLCKKFR